RLFVHLRSIRAARSALQIDAPLLRGLSGISQSREHRHQVCPRAPRSRSVDRTESASGRRSLLHHSISRRRDCPRARTVRARARTSLQCNAHARRRRHTRGARHRARHPDLERSAHPAATQTRARVRRTPRLHVAAASAGQRRAILRATPARAPADESRAGVESSARTARRQTWLRARTMNLLQIFVHPAYNGSRPYRINKFALLVPPKFTTGPEGELMITIGDVIRDREPYYVRDTATALDAAEYMMSRNIGAVCVLNEDGKLSGIFSER